MKRQRLLMVGLLLATIAFLHNSAGAFPHNPSFPLATVFYSRSCANTTFCGCDPGDTATGGGADCFAGVCPASSLNRSVPSAPTDPSGPGWITLCRDSTAGINCEPAVTWVQCEHTP